MVICRYRLGDHVDLGVQMCTGCAVVAGVVFATSQFVPIQAQPVFLASEVSLATRSLAAFPGSSQILTSGQRSVIKDFVFDNTLGERVICTVTSLPRDSVAIKNRYKARAKAACDYAKRLNPSLRTSVALRATTTSSNAGRVSVQMRHTPVTIEVPVAEPPAAKNPFVSPFPTVFSTKELVDSALLSVKTYMAASTGSKQVVLIYENSIPETERAWITKLVNTTVSALPFLAGQVPVIVVGSTDAFIGKALSQSGRSGYDPVWWCGSETTYERYCAGAGWGAMNFKDSIERGFALSNAGKRAVVAHEVYHAWHKFIDGSKGNSNRDPRSPEGMPMWFAEGMANFMGFAIAHHDNAITYSEGRTDQVDSYMRSSKAPLIAHIGSELNPYGIGQAASEYLVASIGVDRVFEIYRKLGSGKTFASAFEESAGISLATFYERFEESRSNF